MQRYVILCIKKDTLYSQLPRGEKQFLCKQVRLSPKNTQDTFYLINVYLVKFYRVSVLELDGSYLSLILKTENLSYAANKDQCWNTKRKKEEDHAVWPPLPILLECPQGDPAPKWHQLEAVRLGILAASTSILSSFPISMDDASCFHQRELTFVVFITGSSSTGMICALKSPAFTMGPVASGICLCSHHRVLSLMSVDLIVTHSDFCYHHLG